MNKMSLYSANNYRMLIAALLLLVFSSYGLAFTSNDATATLTVNNSWGTGYCANVTIKNNASTNILNWTVSLNPQGSTINNLWNGNLAGNNVTSMSYNGNIAPNGSSSFGFCAAAPSNTTTPTITGLSVSRTTSPSPTPVVTPVATPTPTMTPTPVITPTPTMTPTPVITPTPTMTPIPVITPTPSITPTPGSTPTPTPTSTPETTDTTPGKCDGYATRFWDCCKPHCGWSGNVPAEIDPIKSCNFNNQPIFGSDTQSSCNGGDAHTCFGLAPYAVSNTLSYGYAATSSGDVCGRCFQLDFTGSSHNAPGDPGSSALNGKTMIVQAINIGFDVGGGQFDIMIPGGGVGAFNACSSQWGVSNEELGAQYGGFLSACKQEIGYNASLSEYKGCVAQRCNTVFGSRGLTELQEGCLWYAEWFEAADNPSLKYKEVACPAELSNLSGMDRDVLDDVNRACY